MGHFLPFYALTAQKMKMGKMEKKPGDIIILHNCTKNPDHRLYCSWDMVCDGCNCYFYFGLHFSLLPSPTHPFSPPLPHHTNSPKNENFKIMKKIPGYHLFTQTYQKSWSYAILLLRYGMRRIQLLFFILGKKNEKKTPWDTII